MTPGPDPVPATEKRPGLTSTIRTRSGFVTTLLNATRTLARPSGAFDGITAVIAFALTEMGSAFIVAVPLEIRTETPASVVSSGNAAASTLVAGPKFAPWIVKIDPRAMPPAGKPAGARLAAFTM